MRTRLKSEKENAMSAVALTVSVVLFGLATVQTDDQLDAKKPLIEMDPASAEFAVEWQEVIDATCPNIYTQAELADVVTIRYLILSSDFNALSENALYLTSIWDEVVLIESNSNSSELEKTAAKKLRETSLRPMLERFAEEINRVLGRIETIDYEFKVLSEGRSGTETTPEQIQTRCYQELKTSKQDILYAHRFILGELDSLRAPLTEYYQATQSARCRLGLTERCNGVTDNSP
ncbi:MAG: hypothetical protein ABIG32_00175 [Candidatus Uhrbacteria bacterium]